jgi:starch-binding outer membrane protein, SusD/RagB family
MTAYRLRAPAAALAAALALAGCSNDLELTNPNARSTATFWRTAQDAVQGTNAVYAGLLPLGTYGRWQVFVHDLRSDIATARTSPWGDLANFGRFQLPSYNWEINGHVWTDHYRGISRANQVITNVPGIQMNEALRARLVGEAKFIRALLYFNLVNLYGGNIPLITAAVQDPSERPASSTTAAVYALIETDLTEAVAALPASYSGGDVGRATRGAAQALLGKARLQQRKWAEASAALQPVIASGQYDLLANYADNFTEVTENTNRESLFEVQMGDESTLSSNIPGLSFPRMSGPCHPTWGITFCDVRPTRWYFNQFLTERTTDGQNDPRLDATIYYNRPTNERIYNNRPYTDLFRDDPNTREVREDTLIFFRKYGEYYRTERDFQRWDNPINFRVLRFADVLLMQAEALNEQGQTAAALPLVNRVRQRARLAPLAANLSQAAMRQAILRERLLEFGLEGQRWFDLVRHNQFASLAELRSRDEDFSGFQTGRSELLPIPTSETLNNPNVRQNNGW